VKLSPGWTFDFKTLVEDDLRGKFTTQISEYSTLMGLTKNKVAGKFQYTLKAPLNIATETKNGDLSMMEESSAAVFFQEYKDRKRQARRERRKILDMSVTT